MIDHKSSANMPSERAVALPISVRIPEACRLTGIGRSKLYELIAAGEIKVVKVGSMTLVPVAGLLAFINTRR